MSKTFNKQSREVVDYDIDMTDYFEDLDDADQISNTGTPVTVEITPTTLSPLTLGPGGQADYETVGDPRYILKIWLGGGLDGTRYKVTALITTVLGRVEEIEFNVKVKDT